MQKKRAGQGVKRLGQKRAVIRDFYWRMNLPEEVKVEDAEANLQNGVLELVLPKKMPKCQ